MALRSTKNLKFPLFASATVHVFFRNEILQNLRLFNVLKMYGHISPQSRTGYPHIAPSVQHFGFYFLSMRIVCRATHIPSPDQVDKISIWCNFLASGFSLMICHMILYFNLSWTKVKATLPSSFLDVRTDISLQ